MSQSVGMCKIALGDWCGRSMYPIPLKVRAKPGLCSVINIPLPGLKFKGKVSQGVPLSMSLHVYVQDNFPCCGIIHRNGGWSKNKGTKF